MFATGGAFLLSCRSSPSRASHQLLFGSNGTASGSQQPVPNDLAHQLPSPHGDSTLQPRSAILRVWVPLQDLEYPPMNDDYYFGEDEQAAPRARLDQLRIEHRDLDEVIAQLADSPLQNQLQIQRLKKRKLVLKDMIIRLEGRLIPDINA